MARIIEAEARVTAVDATGNTFEAIASKVRALSSTMRSLGGAASSGIANVNRTIGHLQHAINTLAPIASGAAAAEGMRGLHAIIHETVKATAERAHEAIRMDVAGMSEKEIAEAEQVSSELSARYKALSTTTIMHALRNMRAIVGTYDEAGKILDPILKLRIVAMGAHPEQAEELSEDFDKLVKGMEIKGVTQNPEKFRAYIEGMAKAINVFGDTLRPTDYYEMFKYGRQSTQGLSQQFMLETAPTLAQELGGSSAGKALSSFYQAIVGGRIKEQSVKELEKLGMIDETKVSRTKTGSIKGLLPGGVLGWQTAASDPYAWVNKILLPHLKAHGISSPEQIQAVIGTIFQQATAAQMAGIFATQQPRIQKDWNLVHGARGLDAADTFLTKDPMVAATSVTEQFKTLLAVAGGPLAEPAAHGLNAIASSLVYLQHVASGHPWAAAGGLGVGTAALAGASGFAGIWALRRALGIGRGLASTSSVAEAGVGRMLSASELAAARAGLAGAGGGWLSSVLGPAALMYGGAQAMALPSSDGRPTAYGARGTSGFGIGPMPFMIDAAKSLFGGGGSAAHWSVADIMAAVQQKPAEVKGSADLNVTVQVEPSENFISQIISAIENRINAFGGGAGHGVGTDGATGLSMPPAVPVP